METLTDDLELLDRVKAGDRKAFEVLYVRYSRKLFGFIHRRVEDTAATEEILQAIFISLWVKRETTIITTSLSSYLFGAAKLRTLNHMRSEGVRKKYVDNYTLFEAARCDNSNEEAHDLTDLENTIERSLENLPKTCRTIYRMSRQQHLPIKTIAEHMNISTKTVENQLSIALKHLRLSLGEFIVFVLVLFQV